MTQTSWTPCLSAEGGIAARTCILTLQGFMPVESLRPGMRVITRRGARELRAVDEIEGAGVPVVQLAVGALGPDRPELPLTVAADQPILLRDWRARDLPGAGEAVVAAHRLVDGAVVRSGQAGRSRLYRLRFELPEVIYADGIELACLPELVAA